MVDQKSCAYKTVPSATELHKVPGFDPLRYLRKEISPKSGEKVLKLDLCYKKMWFRLAFPHCRMLLVPRCVTNQTAQFEAILYATKNDTVPLAQFTAQKDRQDVGGKYIQAAQDEALDQALDNAGFGIQLADLVETAGGSGCGSEILLSQVEAIIKREDTPTPQETEMSPRMAEAQQPTATNQPTATPNHTHEPVVTPAQEKAETPRSVVAEAPVAKSESEQSVGRNADQSTQFPQQSPEVVVSQADEPDHLAHPKDTSTSEENIPPEPEQPDGAAETPASETENLLQMLGSIQKPEPKEAAKQPEAPVVVNFPQQMDVKPTEADSSKAPAPAEKIQTPEPADTKDAGVEGNAEPVTYTPDMSVDEICKRMTIEQAKALPITFGPNKGWTLGQVQERRASSLRFYLLLCKDASNELKAGSSLLLDEMTRQRAG